MPASLKQSSVQPDKSDNKYTFVGYEVGGHFLQALFALSIYVTSSYTQLVTQPVKSAFKNYPGWHFKHILGDSYCQVLGSDWQSITHPDKSDLT